VGWIFVGATTGIAVLTRVAGLRVMIGPRVLVAVLRGVSKRSSNVEVKTIVIGRGVNSQVSGVLLFSKMSVELSSNKELRLLISANSGVELVVFVIVILETGVTLGSTVWVGAEV
jgi:hypothetical protein